MPTPPLNCNWLKIFRLERERVAQGRGIDVGKEKGRARQTWKNTQDTPKSLWRMSSIFSLIGMRLRQVYTHPTSWLNLDGQSQTSWPPMAFCVFLAVHACVCVYYELCVLSDMHSVQACVCVQACKYLMKVINDIMVGIPTARTCLQITRSLFTSVFVIMECLNDWLKKNDLTGGG